MSKDYRALIQELFNNGDSNGAKPLLDEWERAGASSPDYYLLRAELLERLDQSCNAWLWLWRGLQQHPDNASLTARMKALSDARPAAPIRVLHGTIEASNQMNLLSKGLNRQGILSHTMNFWPSYLGYPADYIWSFAGQRITPAIQATLRKLAKDLLPYYDIFHFLGGRTFTTDFSDLPILKEAGKAMLMYHMGSEVRLLSEARKTNPYARVKIQDEGSIKRNLELWSRHIEHCMVIDMELYQYVKPYYAHVHVVPTSINLEHFSPDPNWKPNDKPLIVHAPTSTDIKGTSYIVTAIEKLKTKYSFDFQLIQKMSNEQAMQIYRKADLIIDQLHLGVHGVLAVEAMAMEKPVVCWISDYMKEHYPDDLPMIHANPDTIENVLEHVLRNRDMLPEIGRKGRPYVEKQHDMVKNSGKVLELYRSIMENKK